MKNVWMFFLAVSLAVSGSLTYSGSGTIAYDLSKVRTLAFLRNTGQAASDIVAATTKRKAGVFGARLALDISGNTQVSVFGPNILSKKYLTDALFVGGVKAGYLPAIRNDPVTYGVTLTGRF